MLIEVGECEGGRNGATGICDCGWVVQEFGEASQQLGCPRKSTEVVQEGEGAGFYLDQVDPSTNRHEVISQKVFPL